MTDPASVPARRLLSLDVLRGITIAFMIMVNNNGGPGSWKFMNHAAWNGLTPTDLVFPTFVFVVGISIAFAFEARLAKGATRRQLAWHTARRAATLFVLGVIVNTFPFYNASYLRIYGVLQRIALCYLFVGLFYLWDRRVWTKVAALTVALLGYWALLWWVPVPGAGMPGRDIPFMDQSRNLVSWLDRLLMPNHLYLDWVDHNTRDPEGLLSTLPALGTALLGLLCGLWLRSANPMRVKGLGLALAALGCLATGYLWSLWFPLNKNMWTSSYVLVAAGWSLTLLTAVYWAVELKGWRTGWTWPCLVFGSNAIVAYMFSELFPSLVGCFSFDAEGKRMDALGWTFAHVFARIPDPGWAAFSFSISFLALCLAPVWILYRRRVFVKI
jgi:predicted acyltransferase